MTISVAFREVCRYYGDIKAVDKVDLSIEEGEFFAMLGPSGSGKTTCLRLIAGFEQPTSGHIEIFGETAEDVPPYQRDVNTVFQDYALFPHMNILENVGFGLMIRGISKNERNLEAEKALQMVRLSGYGARRPSELSGGQRQRVAVARAIANKPRVLLLDEPLGALDLKLREQMQDELKALQKTLGITFIFVTHDQGEALSMADRIAVFNNGKIIQIGTPKDIYQRPETQFVANFVGSSNIVAADYAGLSDRKEALVSLRPESIKLVDSNGREAIVISRSYMGGSTRLNVESNGVRLNVVIQSNTGLPRDGEKILISWDPEQAHLLSNDQ